MIDSSFVLEWLLGQTNGERAKSYLESEAELTVHPLFWIEVSHVLTKRLRRGQISAAFREDSLSDLRDLKLVTLSGDLALTLLDRTVALSDRFLLSAYDATHLAAALHTGAKFATFDNALAMAARDAGLEVLRVCFEIRFGGYVGGGGCDSNLRCGLSRAVAGWPRSPRRPSAIRLT